MFFQPKLRSIIKSFLDRSLGQQMEFFLPSSSFHWECGHLKVLAAFRGLTACVWETAIRASWLGWRKARTDTHTFNFPGFGSQCVCSPSGVPWFCYMFIYAFTGLLLCFLCVWKHFAFSVKVFRLFIPSCIWKKNYHWGFLHVSTEPLLHNVIEARGK